MSRSLLLVAAAGSLLIGGCQTRPPLSRADYLAMTTRTLPVSSIDEAVRLIEATFEGSNQGAFDYVHSDAGVQVMTRAGFFSGPPYVWAFALTRTIEGVRVQVGMTGQAAAGMLPVVTSGGGFGLAGGAVGGVPVQGNAGYDLLWSRMDYMLGVSPEWRTCQQQQDRALANIVWGPFLQMCALTEVLQPKPRPWRPAAR